MVVGGGGIGVVVVEVVVVVVVVVGGAVGIRTHCRFINMKGGRHTGSGSEKHNFF